MTSVNIPEVQPQITVIIFEGAAQGDTSQLWLGGKSHNWEMEISPGIEGFNISNWNSNGTFVKFEP